MPISYCRPDTRLWNPTKFVWPVCYLTQQPNPDVSGSIWRIRGRACPAGGARSEAVATRNGESGRSAPAAGPRPANDVQAAGFERIKVVSRAFLRSRSRKLRHVSDAPVEVFDAPVARPVAILAETNLGFTVFRHWDQRRSRYARCAPARLGRESRRQLFWIVWPCEPTYTAPRRLSLPAELPCRSVAIALSYRCISRRRKPTHCIVAVSRVRKNSLGEGLAIRVMMVGIMSVGTSRRVTITLHVCYREAWPWLLRASRRGRASHVQARSLM
jgi:hypothetical protein